MYFDGVDGCISNKWVNQSAKMALNQVQTYTDVWTTVWDFCIIEVDVKAWVWKKLNREGRQSISPDSLSYYHVHRWTGDMSHAVTAPLLLDTDMSGPDLCRAQAQQGALVGSWRCSRQRLRHKSVLCGCMARGRWGRALPSLAAGFDSCESWKLEEQVEPCRSSGLEQRYLGRTESARAASCSVFHCPKLPTKHCILAPRFHLLFHKYCMWMAWTRGRNWWDTVEQQSKWLWTGNTGGVVVERRSLLQASHKAICIRVSFVSVGTEERQNRTCSRRNDKPSTQCWVKDWVKEEAKAQAGREGTFSAFCKRKCEKKRFGGKDWAHTWLHGIWGQLSCAVTGCYVVRQVLICLRGRGTCYWDG